MWEIQVQSLSQEDPLEKETATHWVFLPGESHGWRSLTGYSPWSHKELDMTEWLTLLLLTLKLISLLAIMMTQDVEYLNHEQSPQSPFNLCFIEKATKLSNCSETLPSPCLVPEVCVSYNVCRLFPVTLLYTRNLPRRTLTLPITAVYHVSGHFLPFIIASFSPSKSYLQYKYL